VMARPSQRRTPGSSIANSAATGLQRQASNPFHANDFKSLCADRDLSSPRTELDARLRGHDRNIAGMTERPRMKNPG